MDLVGYPLLVTSKPVSAPSRYVLVHDLGLLATSSRCTSKAQACHVEATSISVVKRVLLVDPKWKL
jgi:hypothetical protein